MDKHQGLLLAGVLFVAFAFSAYMTWRLG